MKRKITWLAVVVLASAAALTATGAASAAGTTQVDGIQTLASVGDPFDPADDVYRMDGYGDGRPALIGYWRTTSFLLGVLTPSGVVTGTGTEEFEGCLDANGDGSCGAVGADRQPLVQLRVLGQVSTWRRSRSSTDAATTRSRAALATSRAPPG